MDTRLKHDYVFLFLGHIYFQIKYVKATFIHSYFLSLNILKWHIHAMLKQSCGPLCGLIFSTSINYNKSVHKRAFNTFFQTIFKNGLLLISSLLGKWLQHWLKNRLTSQTYYMYPLQTTKNVTENKQVIRLSARNAIFCVCKIRHHKLPHRNGRYST